MDADQVREAVAQIRRRLRAVRLETELGLGEQLLPGELGGMVLHHVERAQNALEALDRTAAGLQDTPTRDESDV